MAKSSPADDEWFGEELAHVIEEDQWGLLQAWQIVTLKKSFHPDTLTGLRVALRRAETGKKSDRAVMKQLYIQYVAMKLGTK